MPAADTAGARASQVRLGAEAVTPKAPAIGNDGPGSPQDHHKMRDRLKAAGPRHVDSLDELRGK